MRLNAVVRVVRRVRRVVRDGNGMLTGKRRAVGAFANTRSSGNVVWFCEME